MVLYVLKHHQEHIYIPSTTTPRSEKNTFMNVNMILNMTRAELWKYFAFILNDQKYFGNAAPIDQPENAAL